MWPRVTIIRRQHLAGIETKSRRWVTRTWPLSHQNLNLVYHDSNKTIYHLKHRFVEYTANCTKCLPTYLIDISAVNSVTMATKWTISAEETVFGFWRVKAMYTWITWLHRTEVCHCKWFGENKHGQDVYKTYFTNYLIILAYTYFKTQNETPQGTTFHVVNSL